MMANVDFKYTIAKNIKGGDNMFSIVFKPELTDIQWIRKSFKVHEDDQKDEIGGKYGVS